MTGRFLRLLPLVALALAAPDRSGAADPGLVRDGNEIVLARPIAFAAGSPDLLPQSEPGLEPIRAYLAGQPAVTLLRIEAHVAEGTGADEQARLVLSLRRALAVALRLVELGVDCKRLLPVGFGSTRPRYPRGDAGNERIQFVNAALRGRPIGGMPVDGGGMPLEWTCGN